MSLSFSSLYKPFEQTVAAFIDKIAQEQSKLKKSDLIQLWNTGTLHDSSRIIVKEVDRYKQEEKSPMVESLSVPVSKHSTPLVQPSGGIVPPPLSLSKTQVSQGDLKQQQCIFKITRGDKAGEQCSARAKHDMYCVKHYKDPKDKKPEASASTVVPSVTMTSSEQSNDTPIIDMKLKKKSGKSIEIILVGTNRVIKNTSIVVNDKNEMIGYFKGDDIIHEMNPDMERVKKEYQLSFVSDEVDE